jgi:hypothetical protein
MPWKSSSSEASNMNKVTTFAYEVATESSSSENDSKPCRPYLP